MNAAARVAARLAALLAVAAPVEIFTGEQQINVGEMTVYVSGTGVHAVTSDRLMSLPV